jgi:hypothetical protein
MSTRPPGGVLGCTPIEWYSFSLAAVTLEFVKWMVGLTG